MNIPSGSKPEASRRELFFSGMVLLLGYGLIVAIGFGFVEILAMTLRSAHEAQIRRDMEEVLVRTAVRGDMPRHFSAIFQRLTSNFGTLSGFIAHAGRLMRRYPGVLDLYVFDPAGRRCSGNGLPSGMVFASQHFLKAITGQSAKPSEKMVAGFAGNPDGHTLVARSGGALTDLLNGDRRTWGGWWEIRKRGKPLIGHAIVFVHRAGISERDFLNQAVDETNRLLRGRFTLRWYDPAATASAYTSRRVTEDEGVLRVYHPMESGIMLECSSHQALPVRNGMPDTAGLAGLALFLGGFLVLLPAPGRLRSRLIALFLVGGGVPLLVFLATVTLDRREREELLVARFQTEHLRRLVQIDEDMPTQFNSFIGTYHHLRRLLAAGSGRMTENARNRFKEWFARLHGLVSAMAVVYRDGRPPLLMGARSGGGSGGGEHEGLGEIIQALGESILNVCNGERGTGGEASRKQLSNLIVRSKKPFEWFEENDVFRINKIGAEAVLSYFFLPSPVGPGNASVTGNQALRPASSQFPYLFLAMHSGRKAQIRFLTRFVREQPVRSKISSRFLAVPATPGSRWPSFPHRETGEIEVVKELRDLVVLTGLPQHRIGIVGRRRYFFSAVQGQNLDGYVLFLAQPYENIRMATDRLNLRAAQIALAAIFLAGLTAWLTSLALLRPISQLSGGLSAFQKRDFQVRIGSGRISELGVMADRLNQIMTEFADIELAKTVQESLCPTQGLSGPGWEICGAGVTAADLGGDYHDWFLLPEGRLIIVIGDVAGHGISSALVAASAKILLALGAERFADPAQILGFMNEGFCDQAGRLRPMTCWLGIFDPVSRRLQYANAGHNYPVAVTGEGKVIDTTLVGYPLGVRRRFAFKSACLEFPGAGRLYLYTDGLIEAVNRSGELLGYEGFQALALASFSRPLEQTVSEIIAHVSARSGVDVPADDQTLMVFQVGEC
jgi:hypothetical protein